MNDTAKPESQEHYNYYRERLMRLTDGVFGMNLLFIASLLYGFVVSGLLFKNVFFKFFDETRDMQQVPILNWIALLVPLAIGFIGLPSIKKINYGLGKPDSNVIKLALMFIVSCYVCGLIGIIVLQHMASKEFKRWNVKVGPLMGRKKIYQLINEQFANR